MKDGNRFSWRARARSFRYAFAGIARLVRTQHNAWIHCVVAACVIVVGLWLGLAAWEWAVVAVCIGVVLAAEGFNSAIEALADRVTRDYDEAIGHVKDLAAGAVLLVVIGAVAAGLIIFLPKIYALLSLT